MNDTYNSDLQEAIDLITAYYEVEFGEDVDYPNEYSSGSDNVYPLMYTSVDGSDGYEHDIQVSADLDASEMVYYVDNAIVYRQRYKNLREMIDKELFDFEENADQIFDYYYGKCIRFVD